MAGPTIDLPSVALRSANLRLQGTGQGAVSAAAYGAELPSLVDEISAGTIVLGPTPFASRTWNERGRRTMCRASGPS
jgi:hypothetical protein